MTTFLLRRTALTVVTLWGVVTFVFLLIHMIPGDPVESMLGEGAKPEEIAAMRKSLGLDAPLVQQYARYWRNLSRGELGTSFRTGESVMKTLKQTYPATLQLTLSSLSLGILVALPLGVYAARRRGRAMDSAITSTSLLGISIPHFVLGPLLIIALAISWPLLPVSGMGDWAHLVLPTITLGTALAAVLVRMIRSSMINELSRPYVITARAKGLSRRRVIYLHALKNGLMPVVTILGLQFGGLLAGAIITETIFSWQGIGRLMIQSIQSRDYPLIQSCILAISVTYIAINLLTDLVYSFLDPRVRY
ncbi:MAG TPA: ABC transporter permease [Acidobacteriota bacterium]|jgi:peptide/nickel transport system permease protein|nr:ABC transporter permease [Acidobacteriota bacterium]